MISMRYDRANKQNNYKYMARSKKTNRLVVGYIVGDCHWYSHTDYKIYYNEYAPGGFCGGAIELGLRSVDVDPNTIVPYNQMAEVKYNQENGFVTLITNVGQSNRWDIRVMPGGEFPYFLWDDGTEEFERIKKLFEEKVVVKKEISLEQESKDCAEKTVKFPDFATNIINKQKERRQEELFAALMEFWNKYKNKYAEIVVGIMGDCEYIDEENGTFTCTMLEKSYNNIEDLLHDFCKEVDPDEVEGFNIRRERKQNEIKNKS